MADSPKNQNKYEDIPLIFKLIDDLSTEAKLELVTQFASPSITNILFQLVLNMTDFEKKELLDKINQPGFDKREHQRKDCLLITDYVIKDKKDRFHKNFVKDISEGGVFIETHENFDVGDEIIQSFAMFDEQILFKFSGEIVRIDKEGIGVKFTNLTPYQLDMLKSVVKKAKK